MTKCEQLATFGLGQNPSAIRTSPDTAVVLSNTKLTLLNTNLITITSQQDLPFCHHRSHICHFRGDIYFCRGNHFIKIDVNNGGFVDDIITLNASSVFSVLEIDNDVLVSSDRGLFLLSSPDFCIFDPLMAGALFKKDDQVYLLYYKSIYKLDVKLKTLRSYFTFSFCIDHASCFLDGDELVLFGPHSASSSIYRFNFTSFKVAQTNQLPFSLKSSAILELDDSLLVINHAGTKCAKVEKLHSKGTKREKFDIIIEGDLNQAFSNKMISQDIIHSP